MAAPAWGAPITCAVVKKAFAANCVMCHMTKGTGNSAIGTPDFTDPKWQAAHKNTELIDAVTDGVKGTAMPSWKGQFSSAEIDALVKCVVRGFGKKAAPAAAAVAAAAPAHHGPSK
ncbi:MAG TPA: c-type cytochrome [Candidatus Dormibacteraeota bacterium]|nr:c-type cytochrome [Candidatus Dormibacteraeota bacterium]